MNTKLQTLLVSLLTLSPLLALGQNVPEGEILSREANSSIVKAPFNPDPEQWAEFTPEERAELEAEGGGTYTMLASGLNYFADGEWRPSKERFLEYQGGIVAQEGQTKVIISKQFLDPRGVVDTLTPEGPEGVRGERLQLSVYGLAWFDRESGESVLVAEAQPSQAILVPPNQIIFLGALAGDGITADVRMTYRLGSFEVDVIIREFQEARDPAARNPQAAAPLVGPKIYGLSDSAMLEVWHKVVSSPNPAKKARVLKEAPEEVRHLFTEPDIIDEELTFGAPGHELKFVQGKAFSLTDEEGEPLEDRSRSVPTAKQWLDLGEDGVFLVERVEYSAVQNALEALPRVQVNATRQPVQGRQKMLAAVERDSSRRTASAQRGARAPSRAGTGALAGSTDSPREPAEPVSWDERLAALGNPAPTPGRQPAVPPGDPRPSPLAPRPTASQLALVEDFERRPGFAIDYITKSGSQQDTVFRGDETYYISAPFTASGTPVFEGGAVLKMDNDAYLEVPDAIEFQTDMFRPITVTYKGDGTIGQFVSTNTPTSTSYPAAIKFPNSGSYTLKHVRFRYGSIAIETSPSYGSTTVNLWHAQIVSCYRAFKCERGVSINLRNVLANSCTYLLDGNGSYTQGLNAQHLTANSIYDFDAGWEYLYLYNCLVTGNFDPPSSYGGSGNYIGSSSGIYQTVGAGKRYLAEGSPHRDAGTGTISSALEADLKQRTTYPPVILDNVTLNEDTTWYPIVQRDNDGYLDRGYHYSPIDYAINYTYVANGVTLSVEPGTALAQFGYYGVRPKEGSTTLFNGTAENLIVFCRYESVQENPQRWDAGSTTSNSTYYLIRPYAGTSAERTVDLTFTDFCLADDGFQVSIYSSNSSTYKIDFLSVANCRFYNGKNDFRGASSHDHELWNNLFLRGDHYLYYYAELNVYNNLFIGLNIFFHQISGASAWTFRDNIFDKVTISYNVWDGATQNLGYNGYINMSGRLNDTTYGTDVVIAGSMSYETGPFGDYYQPDTNNDLLNAGSRSAANAGLYHHTVFADGTKDSGTVDIGFHYVAHDGNDDPVDTDGDGIPDYVEDTNGDGGDPDSGETDWDDADDLGLFVLITHPKDGQNIP